jgi:hypothetical protein
MLPRKANGGFGKVLDEFLIFKVPDIHKKGFNQNSYKYNEALKLLLHIVPIEVFYLNSLL